MLVFCLLTGQYVVCAIDSLFPTSCSVCLQCWEHYFLICKHPLLSNSCGTPGGAREVQENAGVGRWGEEGGVWGFGEGGVLEGGCEHYQKALIEKKSYLRRF